MSKDRIALIIAKMGKNKEGDRGDSEYSGQRRGGSNRPDSGDYSEGNVGARKPSPGEESAADDVLSAIDKGDAGALASALADFIHIHSSDCSECEGQEKDDNEEGPDEQ